MPSTILQSTTARNYARCSTALSAKPPPLVHNATLASTSIVSFAAATASPIATTAPTLKIVPSALQDIITILQPAFLVLSFAMPATRSPVPLVNMVTMPAAHSASSAQASYHFASIAQLELTAALVLQVITHLEAHRDVFCAARLRLDAAPADRLHTARLASPTTTSVVTYARLASLTLPHAAPPSSATAVPVKLHRCVDHA